MLIRLYALLSICCLTAYCLPDLAAQCSMSAIPSPAPCFGTAASVTIYITGGIPNYGYSIDGGVTFIGSSTSDTFTITNLVEGTYNLLVVDGSGCTTNTMVVVPPAPSFIFLSTLNDNACNGTSINLTVNGGTQPYTYLWSTTETTEDIVVDSSRFYYVTVTDANGCTQSTISQVTTLGQIFLQIATVSTCQNSTVVSLSASGGLAPYSYHWSDGSSEASTVSLAPGVYTVTVTDSYGCTAFTSAIVPPLPPLTVAATITYTNCATANVQLHVSGGTSPYTFLWNTGANGSFAVFQSSGTHSIVTTDANGCTVLISFTIDIGANGLCSTIAGRVLRDTIENCQNDDEPGLANWIVQAIGANTYYGITDSVGQYYLSVEAGNTYTLSVVPPNALWQPCPSQPLVTVNQPNDTVTSGDILVQKTANCPALTVTIATGQLRRCFEGNSYYIVNYCNQGTTAAENAYVIVQLDPYLSFQLATIPHTDLGNGQLRFDLGNVDIGECKSFNIYVHVSCDAALGQTHCTEAHIYPDTPCVPNNPLWSGASLQVQSLCDADSLRFIIKNVGAGNLTETVNYIVIEDQVMLMSASVPPLMAGDSVQLAFPANGSTWRVEVGQVAFHPGESRPSVSVEGCTTSGSFSTGFVSQFPSDDADPWLDIDCTANAGSYDPNDKQGFPIGYGTAHYIRPGTDIEYKIRFQNTGTDTAFTVLVVDTLSAWLDPSTLKFGPSSHPYRAEIYGPGILKFHFENILLPDSNVNEIVSHGFLQFRISPRADAPLETLVENQAAIYFDFNAPILTNTTFHRLGEQFVTTGLWQPHVPGATIVVSPNPFDQQARLEVKGMTTNTPLKLQVFDLQGNKVREMNSSNASFLLNKGNCPSGVYLFRISEKGKLVGTGKLMVQ